ncbi:hypothetical protein G4B88_022182 [Cannabis sativa]|uniref:Sulfotransferase n=1 Tax=Cannabis sativa TaxID=3483 RepID=A0A7J6FXV8_CANSA|nr:hypothetical protein G4B88_022182 [Cannabis sativa]
MKNNEEDNDEILAKLEKAKDPLRGFWTYDIFLKGIISFQTQFVVRNDDIVLASCPKSDVFVSNWHFNHKFLEDNVGLSHLEETFDLFCNGIHIAGPFWDHILGFWKANAEFLGFPFSAEVENNRVVPQEIQELCSFDNLKNLEGRHYGGLHELSNIHSLGRVKLEILDQLFNTSNGAWKETHSRKVWTI